MRRLLFIVCMLVGGWGSQMYAFPTDSLTVYPHEGGTFLALDTLPDLLPDSVYAYHAPDYGKKRPWRAGLETFMINIGVLSFDRFVMNEDFAKVNLHTIHRNFQKGFVWDNDQFSTNLFAHPYHGGLYFNSARCNGLSFWESAPYALCGSLMWEFTCEIEPPAINDLMATTMGGIAIGEVTHRMSALVLDDSSRGMKRFFREFFGTLICPIRGLNRIISGDAWRVKYSHYKYHDYNRIPVHFSAEAGIRYLADDNNLFKGETNPYVNLKADYGEAFNEETSKPYDYFTASLTMGLSGNQPLIQQINLLGRIWGKKVPTRANMEVEMGLFQYFNYFDSEPVIDGTDVIPYKISEAASIGPGVIYRFPELGNLMKLEQRIFLGAILLGGSLSDYYHVIDRNYNMGSGYSIKNTTQMQFGKYGRFAFNLQHYQIFTWKGYDLDKLGEVNPLYLNAQGDKGFATLLVVNPVIEINVTPDFCINTEASYYYRRTHYQQYADVTYRTFEARLGAVWHF